jgi:hypothetical protein
VEKVNAASVPRAERILRRVVCLPTDMVGMCVRITGPKVGNKYQVAAVDITLVTAGPAVGILIDKTSPTDGLVQFHGPVRGVYGGLVPGQPYMVGFGGLLAAMPPVPGSGQKVLVQHMGVAIHTDELLVSPAVPMVKVG